MVINIFSSSLLIFHLWKTPEEGDSFFYRVCKYLCKRSVQAHDPYPTKPVMKSKFLTDQASRLKTIFLTGPTNSLLFFFQPHSRTMEKLNRMTCQIWKFKSTKLRQTIFNRYHRLRLNFYTIFRTQVQSENIIHIVLLVLIIKVTEKKKIVVISF